MLDIGPKKEKYTESFYVRIATPAGLASLDTTDGIIAHNPIVVMATYDFQQFRTWAEAVVRSCECDSWSGCIERLSRHFTWEFQESADADEASVIAWSRRGR